MSFPKIMALIPVLSPDSRVADIVSRVVTDHCLAAHARSWKRLRWLVRERPATAVVLDSAAFPDMPRPDERIADLRRRFPSLGLVLVFRPEIDRFILLRLGRAAIDNLELVPGNAVRTEVYRALRRAEGRGARSRVLRAIGIGVPSAERQVIRAALEGALMGWTAGDLAERAGWSRPHLSVRLKAHGLPSTGKLLRWSKLLHAGQWLAEPGRSAESVSRQLEYANGPVFRRALRNYLDATPTEIRDRGGLDFVLERFLDVCGLTASVRTELSVA
jgi:AraC-like DNA-binding protein